MRGYEEILRWIENSKDSMTKLLEKWVNTPSGSDNRLGLEKMCAILCKDFEVLGGDIQTIPIETNCQHPARAIAIKKRENAKLKILFGGHMDTVYPMASPQRKATFMKSGKMKGPGTVDMKGGLVILLKTLEAFEKYQFADEIGWEILITPDEETGSVQSEVLHMEFAKRSHIGIIFEPTYSDGSIVTSRKGSMNFSIFSKGTAAHAGRNFHLGKSAYKFLLPLLIELEKLNDKPGVTFNLGKIDGGGPPNIVPDMAIARCNVRVINYLDMLETQNFIRNKIEELNKTRGCDLVLEINNFRPPKIFDKKHEQLFLLFQETAKELSMPFVKRDSGGVCDGNLWSFAGLPTIDTMGATGGGIHTEDEFIQLESLVKQTKLCTRMLMNLASKKLKFS